MSKEIIKLVAKINNIYERSYKKFIDINPNRYENEQDLYYDLMFRIELWDSHAGISLPPYIIKYNKINWRINKYKNAYIMMPNIKYCEQNITKYYSVLKEIVSKNPKNITINLTAQPIANRYTSRNIMKYIMPLIKETSRMDGIRENGEDIVKYTLSNKVLSEVGEEEFFTYNKVIIPYNGIINLIIPNTLSMANISIITKSLSNFRCYLYAKEQINMVRYVYLNGIDSPFGIVVGRYENLSPISNTIIGEIPNELMPYAK